MMCVLTLLLLSFLTTFCTSLSPPCAEVSHSSCGDDSAHLLVELDTPSIDGCHHVCWGVGKVCKFFIFDNFAFGRGNCRLYSASFSRYILHCNSVAGPRELEETCHLTNPKDYGRADEKEYLESWQHCLASCKALGSCTHWQFDIDHKLCRIFSQGEKPICSWKFAPREPPPCLDTQELETSPTTREELHQEL